MKHKLAIAALLVLASCQPPRGVVIDDAQPVTYGFPQAALKAEVSADDGNVLRVPVVRTEASVAARVLVELSVPDTASPARFMLPDPYVRFEAGSFTASANVAFRLSGLDYGSSYNLELSVHPTEPVVDGGTGSISVSVSRRVTWVARDSATWTDGLLSQLYQGFEVKTYRVPLYEAAEAHGLYRMENPYGLGIYPYTDSAIYVVKDPCYVMVNATDSTRVVVPRQSLGVDYGFGENFVESAPRAVGSRTDTTITFPANALYVYVVGYDNPFATAECVMEVPR